LQILKEMCSGQGLAVVQISLAEIGGYTLHGNIVHLHFSDNMSKEVITDTLQKILTVQTQIVQSTLSTTSNTDFDKGRLESEKTEHQINSILEEVNKIQEKR
jgi:hypothetical protein